MKIYFTKRLPYVSLPLLKVIQTLIRQKMTDTDLSVCVILPASGSGERFGTDPPKQYTSLLEKPLVFHTLSVFHR